MKWKNFIFFILFKWKLEIFQKIPFQFCNISFEIFQLTSLVSTKPCG